MWVEHNNLKIIIIIIILFNNNRHAHEYLEESLKSL